LAWAVLAPFIALSLRDPALLSFPGFDQPPPPPYQYALAGAILSIPVFLFFRLGDHMSRFFGVRDLVVVAGASVTVVAGSDLILFLSNRLAGVPRSTPLIYGLVLCGGLLCGRALARLSREPPATAIPDPRRLRRILVVGVDRFAGLVIKLTDSQQPRTTQVVAALDGRERLAGRTVNGARIVGRPDDIEAVIEEYGVHGVEIDEVWVTDRAISRETREIIDQVCEARGLRACDIAEALNLDSPGALAPVHVERADEHAIGAPHKTYFRLRRALDIVVAATLLVALAPVAAVVATIVYFDVGGPILFWQRRIGHRGQEFFLHKFRTFRAPYDRHGALIPCAARLSATGRLIRALRFDEIPQLLNMLTGDMSLIGPRPLLPVDQPRDPSHRLVVRPGVTGWAQVVGGTSVTADEKDALDVWYIHHASTVLDLKIIWRTLRVVFRGESRTQGDIDAALRWRGSLARHDPSTFAAGSKAAHQPADFRELARAN
jgi:lipopolysaccharide/colanic/teichoic acid biosynthesis glycosyltransferase